MKIDYLETAFLERSIAMSNLAMSTTSPTNKEEMLKLFSKQRNVAISLGKTKIGSGHDNYLQGIVVRFVLTASNKFWTEFQRYHFADFVTSQSTMHRASNMDLSVVMNENVTDEIKKIVQKYQDEYKKNPSTVNYMKLIYNLPSGLELSADIVTNYRQLKTIISQRETHKLKEWRDFCDYMFKNLPLFQDLTGLEPKKWKNEKSKERNV